MDRKGGMSTGRKIGIDLDILSKEGKMILYRKGAKGAGKGFINGNLGKKCCSSTEDDDKSES